MNQPIDIWTINSSYIQGEALDFGLHAFTVESEGGEGENHITIYRYLDRDNCPGRVANTNGEPVWEESDPCLFAELLESVGIS